MATYAIGDVQGCYPSLLELLAKIKFRSDKDKLWFAGDIVNRGPDSLQTLRFIKSLGENAICVLGNHDLHLLAVAHGSGKQHKKDTLEDILNASDRLQLLDWLIQRPLMHYKKKHNTCLVHAGVYPAWSTQQALACAHEVEQVLQGRKAHEFFGHMYGNKPSRWNDELGGWERLRFITNCFTRMRYIQDNMKLCLNEKGNPGKQPDGIIPWFDFNSMQQGVNIDRELNIVFGHWSTLKDPEHKHLYPLDTGCLWGGKLTALKIDSEMSKRKSVSCPKWQALIDPAE
jgi:bis(5'-nucleosyl)-tetraphosphatase (symmetrical)